MVGKVLKSHYYLEAADSVTTTKWPIKGRGTVPKSFPSLKFISNCERRDATRYQRVHYTYYFPLYFLSCPAARLTFRSDTAQLKGWRVQVLILHLVYSATRDFDHKVWQRDFEKWRMSKPVSLTSDHLVTSQRTLKIHYLLTDSIFFHDWLLANVSFETLGELSVYTNNLSNESWIIFYEMMKFHRKYEWYTYTWWYEQLIFFNFSASELALQI